MAVPLRTGYEDARYIVYERHGAYYAKDGETGDIVYGGPNNVGGVSGANAAAVIQAAINGLTAGRHWKEKVGLKGTFIQSTRITPASYTILDMRAAKLIAQTGLNDYQLETSYVTDVELIGGILDGNAGASRGVQIGWGSKNCIIRDMKIIESNWDGLFLSGTSSPDITSNILIDGCTFERNAIAGGVCGNLRIRDYCEDIIVSSCKSYDSRGQGFFSEYGTNKRILFSNCISKGARSGDGFLIVGGLDVALVNCIAEDNSGDGFVCDGSVRTVTAKLTGCVSRYNWCNGLLLNALYAPPYTHRVEVEGGSFHANSVISPGTYDGIQLNLATYIKIVGTRCYDEQSPKTQRYGIIETDSRSDYNLIEDNFVMENLTGAIFHSGTHTKVRNNQGYENENRGIAVMAAGGAITVTHHMDEIPVVINVTAQGDLGDVYVPGGDKITVTGFTIVADTPVAGVSVFWEAYAKSWGMYLFW